MQQLPKPIDQSSVIAHRDFELILSRIKLCAHWHVICLGLGKGELIARLDHHLGQDDVVIAPFVEYHVRRNELSKNEISS